MQAAYSAGAAGEAFYNEQLKSILEHYRGAETAAAGIFSSEYLKRRALTDLGIWESASENWYYRDVPIDKTVISGGSAPPPKEGKEKEVVEDDDGSRV